MKWIIYSHTDYLDVLRVQTEYLKDTQNKTLLINTLEGLPDDIRNAYDDFVLYDDKLPYASRLLSLKMLRDDYVLFIHDMDIVISKDNAVIEEMGQRLRSLNLDRIDLKPGGVPPFERISNILAYPYNVNPSIWKLSTFMKVMEAFPQETYRTIESLEVQQYCSQFLVFRPFSQESVNCGYFKCLPWFQFIHITHHGQFMPKANPHMDEHIAKEYESICSRYLDASPRGFKESMW